MEMNNKKMLTMIKAWFIIISCTIGVMPTKHNRQHRSAISHNGTHQQVQYRLPRNVIPINYKIHLWPHAENRTFNGKVRISVLVQIPTKRIIFHLSNMNRIHYMSVSSVRSTHFFSSHEVQPTVNDQVIIPLEKTLEPGNYTIDVDYSGSLQGIVGLYASKVKDGTTMVASKFQPTYTRQAFPCFDEPDFKATYDVSLVKPTTHIALSNMNEVSKQHDDATNKDTVTFATSVPMSSYLACFVICDFEHKQVEINANGIGKNFTMRCYAQKGETHKIDFAQDIGKRATEFYVKYYEVPFPLPKLDMIAIPDYQSGATEHWGLITYRETSFLIDEQTASSSNKIGAANTIAHELAHMWFGNLVTVKWWDDLWLNEGFATYMQVKALNAIEPSWTMLDQFLTKTLHSVLTLDAKVSSHPIVQTVDTPDQITAIFDAISYNKGSSILRMLEGFIGEENFRRAISDYLKKHEFGNTVTRDLYDSLEPYFKQDNPQLNLSYIMDTWTKQMGYPVVTVTESDEPNTYTLTQSRFLLNTNAKYDVNESVFGYRWFIPITYKTNSGTHEKIVWFSDTDKSVKLQLNGEDKWLKINNNQVGYYRVNYPTEMWEKLLGELKSGSKKLTISDRSQLLNDVFALAESGAVTYNLALTMTTYLNLEEEYVVWETASSIFNSLADKLKDTKASEHLEKYIQSLLKPVYDKFSWERSDTGVIKGLLRGKILSMSTHYGLPDAVSRVRAMFLKWLNTHGAGNVQQIEPDIRGFVYYDGMKNATVDEWDKLWEIYLKENDPHEKLKLRNALSAPRNPDILKKFLDLSWDEANVRGQDYLTVLAYISNNPAGEAIIWDHVRTKWPQLVDRFTLNSRYLGNMIPQITNSFNAAHRLTEMEDFFNKYPEAGAGAQARKRALETVNNNLKWMDHNKDEVIHWLESRKTS